MLGVEWLKKSGKLPTLFALYETHRRLGNVDLLSLESVYHLMQGERWSPNGEARALISSLGLEHTSMSTGDVIQIGSLLHIVDSVGFYATR